LEEGVELDLFGTLGYERAQKLLDFERIFGCGLFAIYEPV
jgi:hypothetical protein